MTEPITRKTDQFLILLVGLALALCVASPALAGKPTKPPPEPGPCDGLTNDTDIDQDGYPDLIDCEGLSGSNGGNIDYPGCLVDPASAPNCTDHTLADVFAEVHRDTSTGPSAYADPQIGPEILDDEVFSFMEASLALNVHVLTEGTLDLDRIVWVGSGRSQAAMFLIEDRSLAGSCTSPGATGTSFHGNPNEFGEFFVLSQRIFDKIDCLNGDAATKRAHLLNTSSHEAGHGGIRQAPDADSFHQDTRGTCLMEASIEPSRKGVLTIPTAFCSNSQQTVIDGATNLGPTMCGDTTTYDGDDMHACLPKT
jgi:hypothetical protein